MRDKVNFFHINNFKTFLAALLVALPVVGHAVNTPVPLGNAGMCELLFSSDECLNPPKDVKRAVKNLRRHGKSQSADVVKLGARAVPALVQLAGEKKMSVLVASAHAFAPVHWYYPHNAVAEAALLEIVDADVANPIFKRLALGPRTWFQAAVWSKLIDKGVAFTLPEAKLMFHSSFLFSGDKYGWPAILRICLSLPPEQAVEALVDALHTFRLANLKNMGEVNWKRLDELLDAFEKTDSVHALYYLLQFRRPRVPFNPHPIDQDWYENVFERKTLPPSEANPSSDTERLNAAYDKRIITLLGKHRLSKDELEINSMYFPNPGPEGTYWRLTRYQLTFESPVPGRETNMSGQLIGPRSHKVLTDVLINGKPATFEDGTDWKRKPVTLGWQNPSIYSKKYSLTTISTVAFSAYEPLLMSITDMDGTKVGVARGMGTTIWQRKISPSDPVEDKLGPDPRVKDASIWDFHFKLTWDRYEPAYVTITIDGAPLKDKEGIVWSNRKLYPEKKNQPTAPREFVVSWIRKPPLGRRPQALLNLKRVRPGEGNYRIIGRPHKP